MGEGVGMTKTLYSDYGSIDDVIHVVDSPLPSDSGNGSVDNNPSERWDLGLGWQGSYDAYTGGWSEGAKKALDLADTLAPRPKGKRTAFTRSVAGAFPNVGAHLAGSPVSMYRVSQKAATGRPYVHLYLPIAYSAFVNADIAFNRGCAMVAVIDALENAGCRVKVTLSRQSTVDPGRSKVRYVPRFMVKDYQDRLDIDQLVFTAAHPAFFRRILFALQERSEHAEARKATNSGYGSPCDVTIDDCPVEGNAIRVILPRLDDQEYDAEGFLREMVAALPEDLQTEITE